MKKKSVTKILLSVMVLLVSVAFCACGSNKSTESSETGNSSSEKTTESAADGTQSDAANSDTSCFTVGLSQEISSLDPHEDTDAGTRSVLFNVFEGLVKPTTDGDVTPAVASDYTISDDAKTYTFTLRDGITFQDGNPVTVEDIKYSLERSAEMDGESSALSVISDIKIVDDKTIELTLSEANSEFIYNLTIAILEQANDAEQATNPIGTGPYALTSFDSKTKATLVKNKYYWNGEVPYDNVEIDFLSEDNKALALQNGDINLVENVTSTSDLDTLKKDDNFNVSIGQGVRTGFAYINEKGILGDDTLRQAVQMALDHKTMCEVTVGGLYTEGISVLPSSLAYGYDNLKNPYTYNVDNAKKLLDDAGYKDTDGDGIREMNGKKISINYITYENRRLSDFAQAIQTQLADIGIEAKINSMDADREWNKMVAGEYDLCDSNWITVGNGDPTEYMANWYGKSDANFCNYKNAEYDKLYEQLDTEFDEAKRAKIIEQLQQILINDAAVIVHGYYNSSMISDKTVSGANIHTADYYWLTTEIAPAK